MSDAAARLALAIRDLLAEAVKTAAEQRSTP